MNCIRAAADEQLPYTLKGAFKVLKNIELYNKSFNKLARLDKHKMYERLKLTRTDMYS